MLLMTTDWLRRVNPRMARTMSSVVAESRPLDQLSMATTDPAMPATAISPTVTRFFSPPLTPRRMASPTGVSRVLTMPRVRATRSTRWRRSTGA